jgi:hypothetical protein
MAITRRDAAGLAPGADGRAGSADRRVVACAGPAEPGAAGISPPPAGYARPARTPRSPARPATAGRHLGRTVIVAMEGSAP